MNGKIYLAFEKPWWPHKFNNGLGFVFDESCCYTDEEMKEDWTRGIALATPVLNK